MTELIYTLIIIAFIAVPIILVNKYENNRLNLQSEVNNEEFNDKYSMDRCSIVTVDDYCYHEDKKLAIINICFYFIVFFVFIYVIYIITSVIYLSVNNISSDVLNEESELFNPELYKYVDNQLNLLVNIFTYIIAAIGICILARKWIRIDFKKFKAQYIGYGFLGYLIMLGINYLATMILIILGVSSESTNQSSIEEMMKIPNGALLMGISTIILAPIVEELIFRKSIFKIFKNKVYLALVVSSIVFGSIHIISPAIGVLIEIIQGAATYKDLVNELIYIIPYSLMGLPFGYVYIKTNKNIYTSIITHMINNAVAFGLLLITPYIEKLLEMFG